MIRRRIIATIYVKNGLAVQSYGFAKYLPIGTPAIVAEYLDRWGADEIALLDIDASVERRRINLGMVEAVAKQCRVPLLVGGGLRISDDIGDAISAGADKVVLNTTFLERSDCVSKGAEVYGSQCIVVSIDGHETSRAGKWQTFSRARPDLGGGDIVVAAAAAEKLGAGEILLNSVDRDGSRRGYDMGLARAVYDAVSIPVILLGGAGDTRHFAAALELPFAAVAAGNLFAHTEHSISLAKDALEHDGASIRRDDTRLYGAGFQTPCGRVTKNPNIMSYMYKRGPREVL